MGLFDHKELMIVKGVDLVAGDNSSAEQKLIAIDLISSANGFSLDSWSPNIPSLKANGVWADSSISDGRTLIAGQNTNVTETMTVNLTAASGLVFAAKFAALQRMIQDARAFWDSYYQIEPVYLRWWACGAPGPQFALIYNIDMDVEWDDGDQDAARLTLSIERYHKWFGVRPGGNPKEWTYYIRGTPFNANGAALTSGTDHLVNTTIQNVREWNAAQSTLTSQNYLDIPAASIPGDMDALCFLSASTSASLDRFYFGRSSKPDLPVSGVSRKPAYTLNAGDRAFLGADATTAADTGAPISTGSAVNTRGAVSFATTTTDASRFLWSGGSRGLFDPSTMRGRFLVFARARLSAAGTVTLHMDITNSSGNGVVGPTATLTDVGGGGTGNTTEWASVYLGIFSIPFSEERIVIGENGLGVNISTNNVDYFVSLSAAKVSGTLSLYVADLIFIPIDECAGMLVLAGGTSFLMDSTGHMAHGLPVDIAHASSLAGIEKRGAPLTLKPGVDNRIVVYGTFSALNHSVITTTYTIRLDIIPCWSGIRDR